MWAYVVKSTKKNTKNNTKNNNKSPKTMENGQQRKKRPKDGVLCHMTGGVTGYHDVLEWMQITMRKRKHTRREEMYKKI